jgi:uncharacterized membrane protein
VIEQRANAAPKSKIRLRLDWLLAVIVILTVFNGLPFLAPIFMKLHWEVAGYAIYTVYGFLCHQMAQRSFFLFGPKLFQMYNIADLPVKVTGLNQLGQMLVLRNFVGNDQMGWKVAWSDRMVSMYSAPLLVAIVYALLRRRGPVKPLSLWAFVLLLIPMAVDGSAHWVSDLAGIGQGFRDSNLWLATLTNHALPVSFYARDSLGSFNSLMRLLSGLAFGIAVGGLLYPYIDLAFSRPAVQSPTYSEKPVGEILLTLNSTIVELYPEQSEQNPNLEKHS